jgi:photosystem II stability/assembly factor-like uncharacterized protein
MTALDFWSASRAYPGRTIPPRGFAEASDRFERAKARSEWEPATPPWVCLGPKNIGGRTLAIAIDPSDPNLVWAGSASGGLWRSRSAGGGAEAWERVETGFPVLGVAAIAIDPTDSKVLYIGTGEVYGYQGALGGFVERTTRGSYGFGILKTTDGGATWTKSLDWSLDQRRGVWRVVIDPTDRSTVWAGTTEGVLRSTDGGSTWSSSLEVPMVMDLDLDPRHPTTLFASCGDLGSPNGGIYRTLDGGDHWTKLTSGLPSTFDGAISLDLCRGNPDVVYADFANAFKAIGIYRSTNGGTSWAKKASTDIAQWQGWYSHFVLVSPTNPDVVLAGGIDMWKSTDGGATFTKKSAWDVKGSGLIPPGGPEGPPRFSHADHHFGIFHPSDPSTVYLGNDGGVFRSTDLGETFSGRNGGYATAQFYNGFSGSPTDPNLAIGGLQDNSTVIYDGTSAWREVIGGDGTWAAVDSLSPNILFGQAQYLYIMRSANRGVSWTSAMRGISTKDNAAFCAPLVLAPSSPKTLYAGSDKVYKSTDSGQNWVAQGGRLSSGDPVLSLAVAPTSSDVVFAATAPMTTRARIFRSLTGGAGWEEVTGELPDRYPMDIAIDPVDPAIVYVVFSGFGSSHLFRSDDSGTTWVDIGGDLPDVPALAVAIDPFDPNNVYFGNDLGVWISRDRGESWRPWSDGLPTAIVADLTVSPANRSIRAATHGNGAWERPLEGSIRDPKDSRRRDPER